MNEYLFDKKLNIKTRGEQKAGNHSIHYHPYEPTPYSGLEALFSQYKIINTDHIVDFGCGKGRLNFYINYHFNASVTGIEMNNQFYQEALVNQKNYSKKTPKSKEKIEFKNCLAEEYEIRSLENRFYFFNPFSVQVFMKVIHNILESGAISPREIDLLLYYPSEDYIYFLENETPFELKQEVIIPELNEQNKNERFLIYRLESLGNY